MVRTVTNIKLVVSFWAVSEGQEPRRQPTAQCADNFAMPTSDNKIRPRQVRRDITMAGFRDPGPICVTIVPASDWGTQCRGRTPAPGTLRYGTKGADLHVSKTTSSAAQAVSSGGGGGGGGFFTALSMVNKMVLARTPAPNLEEKLKEFLNSDKVSSIDFVLPNKEDKTFPHDIYFDDEFYLRIARRLGSYVTIFVAADSEISADTAAETKVGGSIYRRQINVRSGVQDKIETQEMLVHEMTHAGLVYDLPKLCHEPVPESAEDLYWALGEVICYVAGASFLLTNGASYGPGDPECTKDLRNGEESPEREGSRPPSKGHTGIGSDTQKRSRVQEESRCSQPVLG